MIRTRGRYHRRLFHPGAQINGDTVLIVQPLGLRHAVFAAEFLDELPARVVAQHEVRSITVHDIDVTVRRDGCLRRSEFGFFAGFDGL
jgi:hypothetical protein